MKKIFLFFAVLSMSVLAISYSSCSSEIAVEDESAAVLGVETRVAVVVPTVDYCGDVKEVRLLAGQHHEAGTVVVGNDEDNLYVTYKTTGDWYMKGLHLFVGDCDKLPTNKPGNLVPGQFPYKVSFDMLKTEYTFVIPLEDIPECYCVAAHAVVVRLGEDGTVVQSETAFGEGERVGKNWFMKFEYCIQDCEDDDEEEEMCYKDETAWAAGPRYTKKGNWATYTPYVADTPIDIFAGQHYLVGTVTFSEVVDGKVTITIALDVEKGKLQEVGQSVKIQGYDTPPSGNPAPGQFKTYKGNLTTVTVDAFEYYGIHLDFLRVIDCEE